MALDLSKYLPSSSAPRYDIFSANVSQIMSGQVSPTRENILSGAYKVTSAPSYDPTLVKNIPKSTNYSSTPVSQPKKSIMQNVWEGLNVPSQLTEKLITQGKGYEEYFKSRGLDNPDAVGALSFGSRMVLDPLNLIPVAKIPKVAKFISKVPGVSKVTGAIKKTKDVVRTGASKVNEIPTVRKITDNLGEKFIKNYGSPALKTTKEVLRQGERNFAIDVDNILVKIQNTFKGVKTTADMENIGKALNMSKAQAIKAMGAANYTRIEKYIKPARKIFADELDDLVKRGRLTPKLAAQWKKRNYFPHYRETVSGMNDNIVSTATKEKRSYLSRRTNESLDGIDWNAPQVIIKREVAQARDNMIQDAFRSIRDKVGIKTSSRKVPEGYKYVYQAKGGFKEFQGYALPEDVYKYLQGKVVLKKNKFFRTVDAFNREWKPIVTAWNTAFHITNIYFGNLSNMMLGGTFSLKRLAQAAIPQRLARKVLLGFTPAEEALFKKAGIGGRGWLGGDSIDEMFDTSTLESLFKGEAKFNVSYAIKQYRKMNHNLRSAGSSMEDNARKAFFLDKYKQGLAKGLSDKEAMNYAVKQVDTYLFDYLTGLTDFERKYMRTIFPFYTWARFNLPLQFRELVKQPHKYAFVSKLEREMNDGQQKDPGEFGDNIAFPTSFKDSQGRQIKFRPMLPMQDLFNNDISKAKDMVSPFIKEPLSLGAYATGITSTLEDPFTNREITNKDLPADIQARDIAKNKTLSLIRPARGVSKVMEEDFTPTSILRFLLGNTTVYDPEQGRMSEFYDQQGREGAIEKRRLQILRSSLSPREKRKAIDRLTN